MLSFVGFSLSHEVDCSIQKEKKLSTIIERGAGGGAGGVESPPQKKRKNSKIFRGISSREQNQFSNRIIQKRKQPNQNESDSDERVKESSKLLQIERTKFQKISIQQSNQKKNNNNNHSK